MKWLIAAFAILLVTVVFAAAPPAKPPTDKQINDLIEKLGDDEFDVRQKAHRDLDNIGRHAYKHLLKAKKNRDLEVVIRSSKLLKKIEAPMFDKLCHSVKKYTVAVVHNGFTFDGHMSGVLVKSTKDKTYVLTCWFQSYDDFCCGGNQSFDIEYGGKTYSGEIVKKDSGTQMALVSFEKGNIPCVTFSDKTPSGYACMWGAGTDRKISLRKGDIGKEDGKNSYYIETENGDAGAPIFFFEEGRLYLTAMAWGHSSCAEVMESADIKEFLKDAEWK
jgi:hypothetical protein